MNEIQAIDRLWEQTGVNSRGCWLLLRKGKQAEYPQIKVNGRYVQINRLSARVHLGYALDDKAVVMHECDNKFCWNPNHLRVSTDAANRADCVKKWRFKGGRRDQCKNGHVYTPVSARLRPSVYGGPDRRSCRICARIRHRKYRSMGRAL